MQTSVELDPIPSNGIEHHDRELEVNHMMQIQRRPDRMSQVGLQNPPFEHHQIPDHLLHFLPNH
jgi:hypothetical protein